MIEKRDAYMLTVGAAAGLALGFCGGWFFCERPAVLQPPPSGPAATAVVPEPPALEDPLAEERPAFAAEASASAEWARWLRSRPVGKPALAYLFSADPESLGPLGGSLLEGAKPEEFALSLTGPTYRISAGAVFLGGGRLLSLRAGRELAREIRRKGVFSMEAVVQPADKRRGGPARIVSLSFDGTVRNFTLGQEADRWVVRLRTSRTGDNATSPEVHVPGLSPRRTHVVVSYDGKVERVYLDGEEARSTDEVAGELNGWDPSFPLVVGNEAYDARDWEGLVRFVAFYTRVLSPEEIRAASKALPPGDPPLGQSHLPPPPRPSLPEGAPPEAPPVGAEDDVF